MKNWEKGDNPWIEHARWHPQCTFVEKQLGKTFIETIQKLNKEEVNLKQKFLENSTLNSEFPDILEGYRNTDRYKALNQSYCDSQERLDKVYIHWHFKTTGHFKNPKSIGKTPEYKDITDIYDDITPGSKTERLVNQSYATYQQNLEGEKTKAQNAEAIHRHKLNNIRTRMAEELLKAKQKKEAKENEQRVRNQEKEDEALARQLQAEEEAQAAPQPHEGVEGLAHQFQQLQVQDESRPLLPSHANERAIPQPSQQPKNPGLEAINPEALSKENADLKKERECKICMDNDVQIVFQPCGHLAVCEDCSKNPALRKCPLCRALIRSRIKTFLA